VLVHGRPKIKIILKAVEAPAHRLMQRSEAGVGLVDPEEPGANAALMHRALSLRDRFATPRKHVRKQRCKDFLG
jgi:hypothetical protein